MNQNLNHSSARNMRNTTLGTGVSSFLLELYKDLWKENIRAKKETGISGLWCTFWLWECVLLRITCLCARLISWDYLALLGIFQWRAFLYFFVCFKLGLPFAHCIPGPITFLKYNKIPKVYSSFLTEPQNCISYIVGGGGS